MSQINPVQGDPAWQVFSNYTQSWSDCEIVAEGNPYKYPVSTTRNDLYTVHVPARTNKLWIVERDRLRIKPFTHDTVASGKTFLAMMKHTFRKSADRGTV